MLDSGYVLHLHYLALPSPELAIERVARRVRLGGHDVPAETIRRRFYTGLSNFFRVFQGKAESWRLILSEEGYHLRLIAEGEGQAERIFDQGCFTKLKTLANEPPHV